MHIWLIRLWMKVVQTVFCPQLFAIVNEAMELYGDLLRKDGSSLQREAGSDYYWRRLAWARPFLLWLCWRILNNWLAWLIRQFLAVSGQQAKTGSVEHGSSEANSHLWRPLPSNDYVKTENWEDFECALVNRRFCRIEKVVIRSYEYRGSRKFSNGPKPCV
jgi:hypothetical protein